MNYIRPLYGSKNDEVPDVVRIEDLRHVESTQNDPKSLTTTAINQEHSELYLEAIQRYPVDAAIDKDEEKRLIRKLDMRILPLLGICYFFYVCPVKHLSIFLPLLYLLDSSLTMIYQYEKLPPAWYLCFNIFMCGALMCQAVSKNFATLSALRVLSGAFEAIADPAFMLFISTYYTREEQPSRIAAYYLWNGVGVAGGGLIVGAACSFWGIVLTMLLPNSPTTFWGFTRDERLMIIARVRRNQTGVEQRKIKWDQIKEAYLDYKTWLFFLLGVVGNIPNGGISNFSTLVIEGLGFDTFHTALLGIPQGVIVVIWIVLGAIANNYLPSNSRTVVSALFMLPTIAGSLGFLLAPQDAYDGRLICFYLTGSYQATFVVSLSIVTSNTGGQSKKMIVSGMIWFGVCVGNIASPFFYKTEQAPTYRLGIGSLLVSNCIELLLFFVIRYVFIWENRRKEKAREALRDQEGEDELTLNATARIPTSCMYTDGLVS
ncbi:hypothetical protein AARAC_001648 [Aspergillus arachidicola]|uniref:Allantoate permease n=1 Tax=Aspergillus arachidicola TaxID=656916 RepID=A0A2G7FJI6_9EURO|nr:hypothetical protein AARAC_001648 [Aspergillus arachidicola]